MVRQFADAYAFLRELVQNSIDAGASKIEVTLIRDMDGEVRTSVGDDGTGMTPTVIQSALLTLFSSSKEEDTTKIGKYGVGFVSVLAIEPLTVLVDTWRAEGAWRVRLATDHDYVIEELEPRAGHGTTVTLLHEMESSDFDVHALKAREALTLWVSPRPRADPTLDNRLREPDGLVPYVGERTALGAHCRRRDGRSRAKTQSCSAPPPAQRT